MKPSYQRLALLSLGVSTTLSALAGGSDIVSIEIHELELGGALWGATTSYFGGISAVAQKTHATLWNRADETRIDLHPSHILRPNGLPANTSWLWDLDEDQQVGWTESWPRDFSPDNARRAALWQGSAESYIDLHPDGALQSMAWAVDEGKQGGFVALGNSLAYFFDYRAAIWESSAESFTDVHPEHADTSIIFTMSQNWQGGYIRFGFTNHAAAWQGSRESFVDLHPEGLAGSIVWANHGAKMVGSISEPGEPIEGSRRAPQSSDPKAAMWSGTAESYRLLHPATAVTSEGTAATKNHQGGNVDFGNGWRAALWSGSAESYLDLHATLDQSRFTNSEVKSMRQDGLELIVSGRAYGELDWKNVEWIITLPDTEPPVILDAEPVLTTKHGCRGRGLMAVTFDVVVEDDSDAADWKIVSISAHRSTSTRGRFRGMIRSRKMDPQTLKMRGPHTHRGKNITYIVNLVAFDEAGNQSKAYPVAFQIDE